MRKLKQASDIIAVLESGDLNHDLTGEVEKVLTTLKDIAPPKGKVKGEVKLVLKFEVEGNSAQVEAAIDSKVPKRARGRNYYWVTDDGALSTEHPQQETMEFGVREVRA